MNTLDPLRLPLSGRQVIEASAGTGKTWTLAALYLRLVLGHGRSANTALSPRQILVMTFTEAATAELRERIRQRLHDAALWFEQTPASQPGAVDPFMDRLGADIPSEDWPQCARRLHLAAQDMDEAAIYTIHGWSRRMLSRFALFSRDVFEQTHLDNPQALLQQLVRDHWRQWFYPLPQDLQQVLFSQLGDDPDKLLKQMQPMWQRWDLKPPVPVGDDALALPEAQLPVAAPQDALQTYADWHSRYQALQAQARSAWQETLPDVLRAAREAKRIKATGITTPNFHKWVDQLQAWAEHGQALSTATLQRFTEERLLACGWTEAKEHALFAKLGEWHAWATQAPECKTLLVTHAAQAVRQAYQQAKQSQSVFDFNDLLQRLHQALHADQGELASAIRQHYPVALVDEFQDTDPWQYDSLDKIYHQDQTDDSHALVMIGDPKQAIYSFRGADLSTYIRARQDALQRDAQACYTLDTNYRSTPALVSAVNQVFAGVTQPFCSDKYRIEYTQVKSASDALPLRDAQGQPQPPLTFWYLNLPPGITEKNHWPAATHVHAMAAGFASQMRALLQQHTDLHPGQMAVLVRSHAHAQAVQSALKRVGLPSVFLSDHANVYQSSEAVALWRVLRAISMPRQTRWLRSAMASSLWGWSMDELTQAMHHPDLSDALAESCQQWLQQWQQHGVLPMLYQWIHSQGVAQRLLAMPQGKRMLTNLLHLGELLQTAATGLAGPQALLHYLAQQIQSAQDNPEEQKMRLETDAHCVQVITFHKSKGLEYPLVFVPFLGSFKAAGNSKQEDEDSDITESSVDEDMRLLYVALTRAKRGLWLGVAETASGLSGEGDKLKRSAVSVLLQRQQPGDLFERLQAQFAHVPEITVAELPPPQEGTYAPSVATGQTQAALVATRQDHVRHWTASFSSLTRGLHAGSATEEASTDASIDAREHSDHAVAWDGDSDTAPNSTAVENAPPWPYQSFPKGARYGTLLHDLLEWQAQQGWPLVQADSPANSHLQQDWQRLLVRKTQGLNLNASDMAMLPHWLKQLLTCPLPLDNAIPGTPALVLHQLTDEQRWSEMEFSFSAAAVTTDWLDRQMGQFVLPGQPRPGLQTRALQGMLTGFMDLVFQHAGRYWVLDYKSNWLRHYDPTTLNAAVLEKRYDVQYVLYTLALHRLLKSRLLAYDYDTHIGGAVYLFLRGIHSEGAGVHAIKPPRALIEQLDAAFAGVLV
jgi:exodeoxyribonuclease V beta subunit